MRQNAAFFVQKQGGEWKGKPDIRCLQKKGRNGRSSEMKTAISDITRSVRCAQESASRVLEWTLSSVETMNTGDDGTQLIVSAECGDKPDYGLFPGRPIF